MHVIRAGRHRIKCSKRTLMMGIMNITPDSFSDGGDSYTLDSAVINAERMIADGADIIDIGGESSRPGSKQISVSEEINRIEPLISYLSEKHPDIPLSIDTWKSEVAEASLAAGASIINDIYGLFADSKLADIIYRNQAAVVVMHNAVMYRRGHPSARPFTNAWHLTDNEAVRYNNLDLMQAVMTQIGDSIALAEKAGISRDQIIVDPGLGFGLAAEESWYLIRNIACLHEFNLPVLIAPSRKRFIGDALELPPEQRDVGTAAVTVASIAAGADIIRVHDVSINRQAAVVADTIWCSENNICIDGVENEKIADSESDSFAKKPDRILMKGMVFYGYTGCLEAEKQLGQRFIIDAVLELKHNRASETDLLEDSVSYADVFELIRGIMTDRRFNLIERLAGFIAEQILEKFPLVQSAEISVSKPQAPVSGSFDTMQVCVSRKRCSNNCLENKRS